MYTSLIVFDFCFILLFQLFIFHADLGNDCKSSIGFRFLFNQTIPKPIQIAVKK